MRVLLREIGSGEYFGNGGSWTVHEAQAVNFGCTTAAAAHAREIRHERLEIVMSFEDGLDVVVPVSNASDTRGWRTERRKPAAECAT